MSTMQKTSLSIAIVTLIGTFAIYYLVPLGSTYAAVSFVAGMVSSFIILKIVPNTTQWNGNDTYQGPTMTLYVGNLPYRVHEGEVKELFGQYGNVNSVRLVRDRKTGRRKGFGFVEMSEKGANKAMDNLNDIVFQERTIKVREAKTQESVPSDKSYGNQY